MDRLLPRLRRLTAAPADADLLAGFAAGDPDAAAELVRRHGPLVYAAARRRLPDPADAADVFQATFLTLLRKHRRVTVVGPWLYRTAALTARNVRRKNARRLARRRPLFDAPAAGDPFLVADLDDALLALPERDRAAVVLCHLQGYSRREAAEQLGLTEGTLSSRLSRALAKLRTKLGDPLPLLAAGTLAVPAGVAAAARPEVLSLAREGLRMLWVKKLTAGGLAAAACVGLGVGVASGPAAADPPPKAADPVAAARQRVAAAERQADVAAKQLADAKAALAATAGTRRTLEIGRGVDLTLTEYAADGKEVGAVAFRGPDGGVDMLRRTLERSAGLPLAVVVDRGYDLAELCRVAQAVADAGPPMVTYTGPRVTRDEHQVRLDKLQLLVAGKYLSAEWVAIRDVLPLQPPDRAERCYYLVVESALGELVEKLPLGDGVTVADVVQALGEQLAGAKRNVWVARPAAGKPDQVLPVDLTGITAHGDTKTNYQLRPGDRVYVKLAK